LKDLINEKESNFLKDQKIGSIILKPVTNAILIKFKDLYDSENEKLKEKALNIIYNLSEYFDENSDSDLIVKVFSNFLLKNSIYNVNEVMKVFKKYLVKSSSENQQYFIELFSKIFIQQKKVEYRLAICQIFQEFGKKDKNMEYVGKLLFDLNSYSTTNLVDLDYENRFSVLKKISNLDKDIKNLNEMQLLPIFTNLIYFMDDDEWNIRENSAIALNSLIKMIYQSSKFLDIKTILNNHISAMFKKKKLFKRYSAFYILESLSNYDKNYFELKNYNNFFKNIMKRDKFEETLEKFNYNYPKNEIKNQKFKFDFFIPIFKDIATENGIVKFSNLKQAFSLLTKNTEWELLQSLLNDLIIEIQNIKINKFTLKFYINLICEIINNINIDKDLNKDNQTFQKSKEFFTKFLIPKITSFLWEKKNEHKVMRMNILSLVIKVLKTYDKEGLNNKLSKIILDIIADLKIKNVTQRELSRETLVSILKELGCQYLLFTLKKLSELLIDGFEVININKLGLCIAIYNTCNFGIA
jgi:hypothetical protein